MHTFFYSFFTAFCFHDFDFLLFTFDIFLRKVSRWFGSWRLIISVTSWFVIFSYWVQIFFSYFLLMFSRGKVSVCPASTMVWLLAFGLLAPQDKERLVPALPDMKLPGKKRKNHRCVMFAKKSIQYICITSKWGSVL